MDSIRALFIMIAILAGLLSVYFSFEENSGGAIGLGIICGMGLVAMAITYIGREEGS